MADDRQVVRDEEVGEAALLLQLVQQVQDLRLHRDVERAGRLVEHDQVRVERQRAGDRDALPLPAGELVRVAVEVLPAEPDLLQQLDHAFGQVGAGRLAIDAERPADDVDDEMARIERGERILEHDLAVAPELPPGVAADPVDAPAPSIAASARALLLAALASGDGEERVERSRFALRRPK